MHLDAGYVAYATECMRAPNHIANLMRNMVAPAGAPAYSFRRNLGKAPQPLQRCEVGARSSVADDAVDSAFRRTPAAGMQAAEGRHGGGSAAGGLKASSAAKHGEPTKHPHASLGEKRRQEPRALLQVGVSPGPGCKLARIGPSFQVDALPEVAPPWIAWSASMDAMPHCRCGDAAVWRFKRWWCPSTTEDGDDGCGFEYVPPPPQQPSVQQPSIQQPSVQHPSVQQREVSQRRRGQVQARAQAQAQAQAQARRTVRGRSGSRSRVGSEGAADGAAGGAAGGAAASSFDQPKEWAPLCLCKRSASWSCGQFWKCDAGVCSFVHHGFRSHAEAPRPEAMLIDRKQCHAETCAGTAAMLTASAYAPIEPFCFVSPRGDCGLGLFARVPLRAGQFVAECA